MLFCRLKEFMRSVLALGFALVVGLVVWSANAVKLSALSGERRFYLRSASSQATEKSVLSLADLPLVRGESVSIAAETSLEEVLSAFCAEVLFCEEAEGVTSYYCYSPTIKNGVAVKGVFVNLHVAISTERCVVGSPLIFGSF